MSAKTIDEALEVCRAIDDVAQCRGGVISGAHMGGGVVRDDCASCGGTGYVTGVRPSAAQLRLFDIVNAVKWFVDNGSPPGMHEFFNNCLDAIGGRDMSIERAEMFALDLGGDGE